jgi:phage gpG-like protein
MIGLKIESNIKEFIASLPISLKLKPKALEDISEIVRKDIEQNLVTGSGIDGASLTPKKRGGRLFYQTGTLLKSVQKRTGINEAEVFINSSRAKIASYLQSGTSKMKARPFFGISRRAQLEIDKYLLTKDKRELFENRF